MKNDPLSMFLMQLTLSKRDTKASGCYLKLIKYKPILSPV